MWDGYGGIRTRDSDSRHFPFLTLIDPVQQVGRCGDNASRTKEAH